MEHRLSVNPWDFFYVPSLKLHVCENTTYFFKKLNALPNMEQRSKFYGWGIAVQFVCKKPWCFILYSVMRVMKLQYNVESSEVILSTALLLRMTNNSYGIVTQYIYPYT